MYVLIRVTPNVLNDKMLKHTRPVCACAVVTVLRITARGTSKCIVGLVESTAYLVERHLYNTSRMQPEHNTTIQLSYPQ